MYITLNKNLIVYAGNSYLFKNNLKDSPYNRLLLGYSIVN